MSWADNIKDIVEYFSTLEPLSDLPFDKGLAFDYNNHNQIAFVDGDSVSSRRK